MKTLILTEAGKEIGRGHLSRALGLSDGFENIDIVCYKEGVFDIPENISIFDWHNNSLKDLASRYKKVVIDSYLMSSEKEKEIRELFQKVIVIDDYNRMKYSADLIINPNIYGDKLDYSNQTAKIVGGKDYIILRDDLIENKKSKIIGFAKNLLITVGGSDPKNLLPKLTAVFKDDFIKIVTIENLNTIELAEVYGITDIAITAGGVTMNELAFNGVPFVAIQTGDDQFHNIQAYKSAGMINKIIKAEDSNLIADLKNEIELLKEEDIRRELSFKGQCLVSSRGAGNIMDLISKI